MGGNDVVFCEVCCLVPDDGFSDTSDGVEDAEEYLSDDNINRLQEKTVHFCSWFKGRSFIM